MARATTVPRVWSVFHATPADWNAPTTHGRFALALRRVLNSYWGADALLTDGRPAGGYAP